MVDIIRPQTRNYAADQSAAIRQGQLAKNIGEAADFMRGAANVYSAFQKGAEARQKELEDADTTMINTQIGTKPQTELLKWNVAQIEAGVDPNSEKYTQQLYAKRDELYQPYIDQMTSEKGRNYLQSQGLQTAERIRQSNIGKIAKNRQKAQAQVAFVDTVQNVNNDAKEFGKLGDWQAFKDATAEDTKALKKYAKANGISDLSLEEINEEIRLSRAEHEDDA